MAKPSDMPLDLSKYLPLVASGKVREIYDLGESRLLFVATDRISAYDVVMKNPIPEKGAILTLLSDFWFLFLRSRLPTLHTHYIALCHNLKFDEPLPPQTIADLGRRAMVVKRLKVFPLESIVRGYITGSAWASYEKDGTVNGVKLPLGLRESEKLPEPLWTPSTKAELGDKDENISQAQAAEIVGKTYADQIAALSLQIYNIASTFALRRGIIIADTKFEFALDESTSPPTVVLVDEVLTPDSSRFWSAEKYQVGRAQDSYDKQYLRDWLVQTGQKGKEGVVMPADVVSQTLDKYKEAFEKLVGMTWNMALEQKRAT